MMLNSKRVRAIEHDTLLRLVELTGLDYRQVFYDGMRLTPEGVFTTQSLGDEIADGARADRVRRWQVTVEEITDREPSGKDIEA